MEPVHTKSVIGSIKIHVRFDMAVYISVKTFFGSRFVRLIKLGQL